MTDYNSIFKDDTFKGKIVLITGGGSGIGRCCAYEMSQLGATVIVCGRRQEPLKKLSSELQNTFYRVMDIRNQKQVEEAVKSVVEQHGPITQLINNAGGQFASPAEKLSAKGWQSVVDLNLNGTWNVTKAVFDLSMKQHGGSIVNVLVGHQNGFPLMAHSGAARAGIENLTKTLAIEWGHYGIRVNAVSPGTILGNGVATNYPAELQDKVIAQYQNSNPSGRLGMESEVSSSIVWLLSPGAGFVTGVNLKVDGGVTLAQLPYKASQRKMFAVYDGFGSVDKAFPSDDKSESYSKFKRIYQDYVQSTQTSKL